MKHLSALRGVQIGVLVWACALLIALTSGLVQAQDDGPIMYAENGDGVVAVFTADDPEEKTVTWSVETDANVSTDLASTDVADSGLFAISTSGELTFKTAPDYEAPTDQGEGNEYNLVVAASDGTVTGYHKVMVEVTNKDEDATTGIELTSLQPEVSKAITVAYVDGVGNPYVDANGVANTAIVDPDGSKADTIVTTIPDTDVKWQWSKSSSRTGTYTDIPGDAAKADTYTPGSADQGAYLRVTATYEDGEDEGKTVVATSMYQVRAFPSGNSAPAFPADFDPDPEVTQAAPMAEADDGAMEGDNVGDQVEANDANNDRLTYSLEADSNGTPADADLFQIDRMTGQVTVGLGQKVNPTSDRASEVPALGKDDSFTVTIKATDPSGLSDTATLTITVGETDEAPVFTSGKTSHEYAEEQLITAVVYAFVAYDPEDATVTYSLSGADASKLSIVAGNAAGELTFAASPNFEAPGSADGDNVYEVTVKASDASTPPKSTSVDVTVEVTNVEEAGTVTLSASQPRIGVVIRVTSLTDIDGSVTGATWQWERADAEAFDTGDNVAEIDGATMDSYTPVDADDGKYLRVTASYTDPEGSDEASEVPISAVQKVRNLAPKFEDEDASEDGIQIKDRRVAETENAPANTPVTLGSTASTTDDPVDATDTDDAEGGDDTSIVYLLSGADAAPFEISSASGSEGQISVKIGAKLDHETKDTYMVTVTARDLEGLYSSVDVTIMVTDVNEAPEISGPSSEEFVENGDGVVAVFTADDPEEKTVTWSVETDANVSTDLASTDVADSGLFAISTSGELTFKTAPDYEAPTDQGEGNEYNLVVAASDGTVTGYHKVMVEVTNKDEDATTGIELTSLQPEVSKAITVAYVDGVGNPYVDANGVANTAIVDPDGSKADTIVTTIPDTDVKWQWSKSSSRTGTYTDIPGDAAKADTYTPGSADQGAYLRVTATYEDGEDEGKTVVATSMYQVRAFPSGNSAPAFPTDFDPDPEVTQAAPMAEADDGAMEGDNVGDQVEANDANNDRLTYSLEADSNGTPADADLFQIDRMTGQVTVGLGQKVNPTSDRASEVPALGKDDSFTVTIKATDPSGLSDTATLTITVGETDEAPVFTSGKTSHEYAEEQLITAVVYAFVAYDPEDATVTYSLSGADASKLSIVAGNAAGELTFAASPNFEAPGSADGDNVYEVTVKASDASTPPKSTSVDVTVEVTNVEEAGTVTLSASQPRIGVVIRVTSLTDIDGSVTGATWQWERADAEAFDTGDNVAEIDGATMDSYTPVDADDGKYLRVTASYTDPEGSDEASEVPISAVQKVRNLAPKFEDEDASEDGIQIKDRRVAETENAPANTPVTLGSTASTTDDPVDATDTDDAEGGDDTSIVYLLSGADAAPFEISSASGSEGQISVKIGAKLDHETKDTYMVTVTARDLEGLSSSVDVTIKVTDVDEAPMITVGGLAISGDTSVDYAEDRTDDAVATYTVAGPGAAMATWDLSGDDAGSFSIDGGVLTFTSSPDFETPASAAGTNVYMVTIKVDDGTYMDTHEVTVMVTNVEEMGMITLSPSSPSVGVEITATLTDPDVVTEDTVTWQWARENDDSTYTDISGATSASYMPVAEDGGKHLRVTVEYTDGYDSSNREMEISDNIVIAVDPLLVRYDTINTDGCIDLAEARLAVGDYFELPRGSKLSLEDARKVVGLHFECRNRPSQ